jgi:hypothetical protein
MIGIGIGVCMIDKNKKRVRNEKESNIVCVGNCIIV